MIWREKRTLLVILGILLVANTIFFFTYRVQYQSRLDELDARMETAQKQLASAQRARMTAERTLQGYRTVERDVQKVFDEYWSTQSARFTLLVAEIKRLAEASSMQPAAYGFQRTAATMEKGRASKRSSADLGVTAVGVQFAVTGSYDQVRRLINLLELSPQFVIIDRISLVSRDGNQLMLTLHLTTLFREETPAVANDRL